MARVMPWTQATIAIKGIWAALVAGLFLAALAFGAVQTVRLEGMKLWPVSVQGWKPRAQAAEDALARVRVAQDDALAAAVAERNRAEAAYQALAERINHETETARTDAMADAERYIAANRVRCQTDRGAPGGTAGPATDHGAGDSAGAGAEAELDAVVVPSADIRICTVNTLKAEAAHEWARGLLDQQAP